MIYDFFDETEQEGRLVINNMKGTFIFRRN